MSGPEGTGVRRPLRTAGWTMLGLAVATALIGLSVVATGGGETSSGEQSATASGPAPGYTSATPSPPPAATTTTSTPVATPDPSPPSPGPSAPAPSGTGTNLPPSAKGPTRGEARVYNNSTISGLAARAASDLDTAGWTVVEVDNYSGGRIPTTTVYYQEGTDERPIAEAIGAELGIRVQPRFVGIANAEPGVIVIVTNDYGS